VLLSLRGAPKEKSGRRSWAPGKFAVRAWSERVLAVAGANIEAMIRAARGDDLPRLREIERAADEIFRVGMDAIADGEPATPEALAAYERAGRAWVSVDDEDRPVAFFVVDVIDRAAHIEQVSVLPQFARQGIGATLIDIAMGWATRQGLEAMTLMTFRDVPWNRPYYERLGFRIVDEAQLTGGLRELQAREAALGLNRWPRVAMRRPVEVLAPS
jgi:GNAT superfamily N-acetyltransferase